MKIDIIAPLIILKENAMLKKDPSVVEDINVKKTK